MRKRLSVPGIEALELRIFAHLARLDQVDAHVKTAEEVFGVAAERVTAEQRQIAKALNFGRCYGGRG